MNFGLDCLATYRNHGVQFDYPDVWTLDEQCDGDVMITVSTEGTCFWALRILPACPSPPDVVNSCVEGFRQEYGDVEVTESDCRLAEMPAFSRELSFECLELLNSAGLHSVRTSEFTLLVWWQGTDHELQPIRRVFDGMTASVRALALLDE
ncbi:MAG: hypothetical protein R3C19_20700 [Planctomycetaceae bacterium]